MAMTMTAAAKTAKTSSAAEALLLKEKVVTVSEDSRSRTSLMTVATCEEARGSIMHERRACLLACGPTA